MAALFAKAGWEVTRSTGAAADRGIDLLVRSGDTSYVVEIKTAAEGRSDRLIPLWSQACLQAMRAAGGRDRPLAIVAAPRIAPRAAEQVLRFAAEYAPEAAAGVVDFTGRRLFLGPHLEGLDAEPAEPPSLARSVRGQPGDLFTDLNQWMLKVLLAPELPETLLSAPRGRYRNASELARAAEVSVMSAFRLVQQLQSDGHLRESGPYLGLVRREELFRRWRASAARRLREVPMRFLLRTDPRTGLARLLRDRDACLALFAAADALGVGFVHGVPPYVYVRRIGPADVAEWTDLVPAEPGEAPDLILRQAPAPRSVFRGAVRMEGVSVCDIVQVWLDVSSHPSRGEEQAALIRRRILNPVILEGSATE